LATLDPDSRRAIRRNITDPVALRRTEPGTYTIKARPDRLTRTQREALS
jgi:hypothetical protein